MSKNILCTIDFSESSRHALQWAVAEAQKYSGHLTILYTYRLIKPKNGEIVEIKKKIEEDAALKFSQLESEILLNQNISYDFRIEVGFINDRVAFFTQHNPIKFLVMDRAMGSSNKESFNELVEHIKVPLVIVP